MKSPRSFAPILPGLMIASLAVFGIPASADEHATIVLRVAPEGFAVPSLFPLNNPVVWIIDPHEDASFNDLDGVAACELSVSDANADAKIDGGEVLDAAVDEQCISSWDYDVFSTGRFVTEIDGMEQTAFGFVTWWHLHVNDQHSNVGIDDLDLATGDNVTFIHHVGFL